MGDLANWKLFFLFPLPFSLPQFSGGNVHWWNKPYMFCTPPLPSQFSEGLSKEEIPGLPRARNRLHDCVGEDPQLNVFRPCSFHVLNPVWPRSGQPQTKDRVGSPEAGADAVSHIDLKSDVFCSYFCSSGLSSVKSFKIKVPINSVVMRYKFY